ncbi:hypothetical protein INT43_001169 [Umbelopsis isabellina]|uniref:Fe2OG dioxygenase domain-containing protein n=1 Tax=Mortierella isabellina TaxID=91625 RepID=A0A8H7UBJ0_MORIS|nr:hypothetical protein INT43_001169 [Umbelopsis isabellina]
MSSIPGLTVIEDFVSPEEEKKLVENCDQQTWSGLGVSPNPELKRRTQQYGYLFSYQYRKVLCELGPFPEFVTAVVARIADQELTSRPPNHLLVNEYEAGQGIMPHTDAPSIFGPVIMSLSLLSPCVMQFTHCETGEKIDICLPRRSMLVMTDEARYNYKHSISKDLIETLSDGTVIERSRRISFTFRTIVSFTGECSK